MWNLPSPYHPPPQMLILGLSTMFRVDIITDLNYNLNMPQKATMYFTYFLVGGGGLDPVTWKSASTTLHDHLSLLLF